MHQNQMVIALIGVGVLDDADKRGKPGAGAKHIQGFAGQQIILDQGAGGLAANQDGIPHLQMLQPGGKLAGGNLDREEFQVFLMVRAAHAVGAHQRAAFDFQADHRELAADEAETGVAGGGETEQAIRPMPDGEHGFGIKGGQGSLLKGNPIFLKLVRRIMSTARTS